MTDFNDLIPSTRTIISVLNTNIDIAKVFDMIVTNDDYHFPESKRGRRKKTDIIQSNDNVPDGSIINVMYGNESKGRFKKKKKNDNETKKYFRNTLAINMVIDGKLMNFKIFTSKDGKGNKTQHPGCKDNDIAEKQLIFLWNIIKNTDFYNFDDDTNEFSMIFHTVMTNVNFSLGFNINRQKLNMKMNDFNRYNSMLNTLEGHAGVNIVRNITDDFVIDYLPRTIIHQNGDITRDKVSFEVYLNKLTDKQRNLQKNKQKKNTFIVFYSGKTIMSGNIRKYMEDHYNDFVHTINEIRDDIEEKNVIY